MDVFVHVFGVFALGVPMIRCGLWGWQWGKGDWREKEIGQGIGMDVREGRGGYHPPWPEISMTPLILTDWEYPKVFVRYSPAPS